MELDHKRALDAFDDFLMIMDDQLDWLIDQAEARGIDLDGSL
jgi:hypothetical protein